MGIVFRQSVKTTIVVFLGALIGALTRYVYVFSLSKQQLGFFTNTITLGAMLQALVMMGMGAVLCVYIQKYPENDERRKVLISLSVIITMAMSLIFALGFFVFRKQFIALYPIQDQALIDQHFQYLPLVIALMGFMALFDMYLISQVKIAYSAFVREVLLRLCNVVLIGLYFFRFLTFTNFIILSVLIYIVPVALLYRVSSKTEGFGFSLNFKAFSKAEYKGIIHFAWYHLLFGASVNLLGYLDTVMLGQLDKSGLESIAPYSIAIFIMSVIVMPYKAMTTSSFPILNKAYLDNDHDKLKDLFHRSGINILIVAIAMCSLVVCNLDNLIAILPKGYEIIKPIAIILMLGKLVDMITGLNSELISISQYYKFNFRISVLLLVMIYFFNRLLIPQYGIYGVAIGVTSALVIFNILKCIFLWYKMQLHPFSANTIKVLLCGIIIMAAGYYLPSFSNPYLDTIIRSALILVSYIFLLLWFKPSNDLNEYLKTVWNNKRLF